MSGPVDLSFVSQDVFGGEWLQWANQFSNITDLVDQAIASAGEDGIGRLVIAAHGADHTTGFVCFDVELSGSEIVDGATKQPIASATVVEQLARLRPHFADEAIIELRVCEMGTDKNGQRAVQALADAAGVPVTAPMDSISSLALIGGLASVWRTSYPSSWGRPSEISVWRGDPTAPPADLPTAPGTTGGQVVPLRGVEPTSLEAPAELPPGVVVPAGVERPAGASTTQKVVGGAAVAAALGTAVLLLTGGGDDPAPVAAPPPAAAPPAVQVPPAPAVPPAPPGPEPAPAAPPGLTGDDLLEEAAAIEMGDAGLYDSSDYALLGSEVPPELDGVRGGVVLIDGVLVAVWSGPSDLLDEITLELDLYAGTTQRPDGIDVVGADATPLPYFVSPVRQPRVPPGEATVLLPFLAPRPVDDGAGIYVGTADVGVAPGTFAAHGGHRPIAEIPVLSAASRDALDRVLARQGSSVGELIISVTPVLLTSDD